MGPEIVLVGNPLDFANREIGLPTSFPLRNPFGISPIDDDVRGEAKQKHQQKQPKNGGNEKIHQSNDRATHRDNHIWATTSEMFTDSFGLCAASIEFGYRFGGSDLRSGPQLFGGILFDSVCWPRGR